MPQCCICNTRSDDIVGVTCERCRITLETIHLIHQRDINNQCPADQEAKDKLVKKYEELVRNKKSIFEGSK